MFEMDDRGAPAADPMAARPLERLGVGEIEAYLDHLRREIGRAEAELGRKRAVRDAADSVFRRS